MLINNELLTPPPNTQGRNRIPFVDWAKSIGIFLVILGHTYPVGVYGHSPVRTWIYLFHMPLFFVVSSLLHKNQGLIQIRKCFLSLILPSILWVLLCCVACSLKWFSACSLYVAAGGTLHFLARTARAIIHGDWFTCGVVWYCFVLVECKMLLELLSCKKKWVCRVAWLAYIVLCILALSGVVHIRYLFIEPALVAFPYFYVGYKAKERLYDFLDNKCVTMRRQMLLLLSSISAFGFLSVIVPLHGYSDVFSCSFGNEYLYHLNIFATYLWAFVGIAGLLLLSSFLSVFHTKAVVCVSKATFVLLCIHWVIEDGRLPRMLGAVLPGYNSMSLSGVALHASLSLVVLIIGCILYKLLKKWSWGHYFGCRS